MREAIVGGQSPEGNTLGLGEKMGAEENLKNEKEYFRDRTAQLRARQASPASTYVEGIRYEEMP